ncbi:NADP-dependent oxidoreductase [Subtercola frigoramans]|uniref:NADPH-dependent curcumin reductase CurA n=1 Tax=Subtercola frigoramans TaxID=120298 RepID=A0ABS2L989_9MICO|nr:NADP-dependent oxidoreductase [Subtercola frigoramans]MBM7473639.1 NADPH-dependent curcumin reductase CurA [Subtercola frigoramans]
MAQRRNRQVILIERPAGIPHSDNFTILETLIGEPAEGQVLVQNRYLSVDPAMRGWVSAESNYAEPVALGGVMRASAVGTVIQSESTRLTVGDVVVGRLGWQDYAIVDDFAVRRLSDAHTRSLPPSLALGILGTNGATAWLGLFGVGQPQRGDLVVVSTAAGAVGSAVGQLARLTGCRTVGITGSAHKVEVCESHYGFDVALNYHSDDFERELADVLAQGTDVYFDNTSGTISDAVMTHLAHRARVVVCGTAAISSWDPWPDGPRVARHLLTRTARMEGFLIQDHADEVDGVVQKLVPMVERGDLRYHEHVLDGLESAPGSIRGLYEGINLGKTIIRL